MSNLPGLLWGSNETMHVQVLCDLESALLIYTHRMILPIADKYCGLGPGPRALCLGSRCSAIFHQLLFSSQITQPLSLFICKMRLRIVSLSLACWGLSKIIYCKMLYTVSATYASIWLILTITISCHTVLRREVAFKNETHRIYY